MSRQSFDLLDEPWIPVRDLDGRTTAVGLREAFARSHEIRSLGGELPTTSVALLRLLLAVLHRVMQRHPDVPAHPRAAWLDLWHRSSLPLDDLAGYFDHFADRFDLLSPDQPFLQVADLQTAAGRPGPLRALIAEVPNNIDFFTVRSGPGVERLDFAEAARWVVHCHAYDPSGIKSGAVGDPRVKGGKGYPIGVGWAGAIGAVVVEGPSLRETLLLNLALNGPDVAAGTEDVPAWERTLGPAEERPGRLPHGPADVLSWPSRRIRLFHDGDHVTGALICIGDRIAPQNRFVEPMTAWRHSPAQQKLLKSPGTIYMPLTHTPERAVWRGLAALLPLQSTIAAGEVAARIPPLALTWLNEIRNYDEDALPAGYPLRTRTVGMTYGSNNSVVDDVVDDGLMVHAVLLGKRGESLRQAAVDAAAAAERTAAAVARLGGNLAAAAGGDQGPAGDRARADCYAVLDPLFRRWLSSIRGPETDPVDITRTWQRTAREVAVRAEEDLLAAIGPAAWAGRMITSNGRDSFVDAGRASLWFRSQLNKALPLTRPALTAAGGAPTEESE